MIHDLRFKVLYIFLIIFILLFSLSLFYYFNSAENELRVSFLDVGQGDSILIETPKDQNILIDGGPDDKVLTGLGRNLPFWERTIDLMILTHPHSDHVAGLTKVLDRYKVDKVMHGDVEYSSSIYNRWESSISDPDIDEIIARKPQTVRLGEDCILKILYPRHDTRGREDGNLNNSSLVSSLDCRGAEFLFTGDIESAPKKELVNSEIDLDADVLKVAHHGAGQTADGEFIERVSPEKAVVSVGENDHGHPNERYLEQLRKEDIEVFRTDKQGAIIFTKNEEGSFIDFGAHSWKDIFY